jgi:hypothetical protein
LLCRRPGDEVSIRAVLSGAEVLKLPAAVMRAIKKGGAFYRQVDRPLAGPCLYHIVPRRFIAPIAAPAMMAPQGSQVQSLSRPPF